MLIRITNKTLSTLFLILFTYIYINVVYFYSDNNSLKLIWFGLLTIIAFTLIYKTMKRYDSKLTSKTCNIIFTIMCIFIFVFQVLLVVKLQFKPHHDSRGIDIAAKNIAMWGDCTHLYDNLKNKQYFSAFPNNWGILLFTSFIYRIVYLIFDRIPFYTSAIINIIAIQTGIVFLYLSAKLIFDDKIRPLLCGFLACIMPGLYLYTPIYYTDTLSIPFVTCGIYLFLKAIKSEKISRFLIFSLLCAVVVSVGYKIKGSLIVLAAAFVIYTFLKVGWKKSVCIAVTLIVSLSLCNISTKQYVLSHGIATQESLELNQVPSTHWIMMGLKGRGGYDKKEYKFTNSFKTYDEKKAANIETIKRRISDYGIGGMFNHINEKISYTWNDSKFYTSLQLSTSKKGPFYDVIINGVGFTQYTSVLYIAMLTLMLVSFIYGQIFSKAKPVMLIQLSVYGLAFFLLLWETRSRYLVNFLPLMYIIAVDGISHLDNFSNFIYKKIKRNHSSDEPVAKHSSSVTV